MQSDPAIICTVCGKQFNNNSNFRRHVKKVCSVEKVKKPRKKKYFALQCDKCDKTYKHSRTLPAHQQQKHGSGQESAVAVASIIAELLLNVKQQGTAEVAGGYDNGGGADLAPMRWYCQICNKSFSKKTSLWSHNYRIHNSKQHRCLVCDETFAQSSNLKRHMAAHKAAKEPPDQLHEATREPVGQYRGCGQQKHGSGQESAVAVASIIAELLLNPRGEGAGRGLQGWRERGERKDFTDLNNIQVLVSVKLKLKILIFKVQDGCGGVTFLDGGGEGWSGCTT